VIQLNVNGRPVEVDEDPEAPLLWVLRDTVGLTGTKYGCGMALCGAQDLVDRPRQQIKPFEPVFHLGEEVL